LQEYALGTDPKNSASTFRVGEMTRNGTSLTITWPSVVGKTYQVQTATSLSTVSWANAGNPVTAHATISSVTVQVPIEAPACFVRVNLAP
jgi:hypothetical protein